MIACRTSSRNAGRKNHTSRFYPPFCRKTTHRVLSQKPLKCDSKPQNITRGFLSLSFLIFKVVGLK